MAVRASEWFILLSEDEAAQVRGKYGQFHVLEPRKLDDGRFILDLQVLEEPAFASKIPFLAARAQCRLIEIEGSLKVRWNDGMRRGDAAILDRTYTPADKRAPFGDPPTPEKGDWSEAVLYESIGRALSRWEAFETEFANLFTSLLGPSVDSTPAHRAYGSVVSFKGRLDMVNAAAEAFFRFYPLEDPAERDPLKKAFDEIADKALRLSGFRNKIAHGIVGPYTSPAGHVRGVALLPSDYAFLRRKLVDVPRGSTVPTYAFTSGEVNYFGSQFWDLRIPTSDLWAKLVRYVEVAGGEDHP